MTGPSDRLAWMVAGGLLAGLALVGGLIPRAWQEDAARDAAPDTEFFAVALA